MKEILCPSCGTSAPANASECPECGTSLFATDERTHIKARVAQEAGEMGRTLDSDAVEEPEHTPVSRVPPPPARIRQTATVPDSTIPFKGGGGPSLPFLTTLGSSDITGEDLSETLVPPAPAPAPAPVQLPPAAPAPLKRSGLRPVVAIGGASAPTERAPAVMLQVLNATRDARDAVTPHLIVKPDGIPPDTQPGTQGINPNALNVQSKKDALIGTKLGEYTVEERVGIGGMGIVYRAVQPMIGNSVAIKVLRPDVIVDSADMNRFLGEARTVNQIRHRSIISIFGAGDTFDGRKYLVMEFLEGESLEARQMREGRLPTADALPILEDVLSALAAAHASNVVHRDLKPANVFLVHQSDGRPWVKLLDFGLARRSSQDVSRIAGTPDYISPEHARGKPAGPPADLYAFGVMAFHLLTGRLPFLGNTPMEVMEQHVHKPPPVPAEIDSSIPPAMSALILRLLDKDPNNRPDAKTVKADLKAAGKQLRAAQTQVGPMPQQPGTGGTVVRTDQSRPQTAEQHALRPDPRLERMAIATDKLNQSPPGARRSSAFSRNWPWFAGGLALLWLLGVAIYVLLTPPPPVHTDAIPIPAPQEEPDVAPEPENDNTLDTPDEPAKPETPPAPKKK